METFLNLFAVMLFFEFNNQLLIFKTLNQNSIQAFSDGVRFRQIFSFKLYFRTQLKAATFAYTYTFSTRRKVQSVRRSSVSSLLPTQIFPAIICLVTKTYYIMSCAYTHRVVVVKFWRETLYECVSPLIPTFHSIIYTHPNLATQLPNYLATYIYLALIIIATQLPRFLDTQVPIDTQLHSYLDTQLPVPRYLAPRYLDTQLPSYLATQILSYQYLDTQLPRYLATQIPSYLDTQLPRYLDTQIPSYLATQILRNLATQLSFLANVPYTQDHRFFITY